MTYQNFDEYAADPALNKSLAVELLKSPAHYKAALASQVTTSPALTRGIALHYKMSGDHHCVAVSPDVDRRTKAGKEIWADFLSSVDDQCVIVSPEVDDLTSAMAESLIAHPFVRSALVDGVHEQSIYFEHEGVKCKARLDLLNAGIVVDWKTIANMDQVERQAASLHYDLQAAWYRRAAAAFVGAEHKFFFAFVEASPPHGVRVFEAGDSMIWRGEHDMDRAVDRYQACLAIDQWPGYSEAVEVLELPAYARLEVDDVIQW